MTDSDYLAGQKAEGQRKNNNIIENYDLYKGKAVSPSIRGTLMWIILLYRI